MANKPLLPPLHRHRSLPECLRKLLPITPKHWLHNPQYRFFRHVLAKHPMQRPRLLGKRIHIRAHRLISSCIIIPHNRPHSAQMQRRAPSHNLHKLLRNTRLVLLQHTSHLVELSHQPRGRRAGAEVPPHELAQVRDQRCDEAEST